MTGDHYDWHLISSCLLWSKWWVEIHPLVQFWHFVDRMPGTVLWPPAGVQDFALVDSIIGISLHCSGSYGTLVINLFTGGMLMSCRWNTWHRVVAAWGWVGAWNHVLVTLLIGIWDCQFATLTERFVVNCTILVERWHVVGIVLVIVFWQPWLVFGMAMPQRMCYQFPNHVLVQLIGWLSGVIALSAVW